MQKTRLSFGRFRMARAATLVFLVLFATKGHSTCCCPECEDYGPEEFCVGVECDPTLCFECNTAIPLTDHLWVLAVLGAAGGAWMLMRKRTEGDLA